MGQIWPSPVLVNEDLLEHSHAHLHMYCLLCYDNRVACLYIWPTNVYDIQFLLFGSS